jgi:hypothetical protein
VNGTKQGKANTRGAAFLPPKKARGAPRKCRVINDLPGAPFNITLLIRHSLMGVHLAFNHEWAYTMYRL